jgi:hypothetical protein
MGDRAFTTLLAWPYPGREHLEPEVRARLEAACFLPESDAPEEEPYWLGDDGAAVLAGDAHSGRILACIDAQANYGTAAYADLIDVLSAAGLHVYAGNDAGGDYGAGWEYHPAAGTGRGAQHRRCYHGELCVTASDLIAQGQQDVVDVPDHELAARTRRLLAAPAGIPPAVLAAACCC